MSRKHILRKVLVPGILGSVLLCQEQALAQQSSPADQPTDVNEQVIQTWQRNTGGGAAPVLKREADGSTRLEWKGSNTLSTYSNNIASSSGLLTTPLSTGTFFKNAFSSDLRVLREDKSTDYFQLGVTESNDKAVLSQNRYQINNIQLGRTGEGYMLALGDIAPQFSSLGSSLAVRGLYGQRQFDDVTVSAFAGLVAESWEVLDHKAPVNQYLKDVYGAKLEKTWSPDLRTYITTQASAERELAADSTNSGASQQYLAPRGKTHSASAGFLYKQGQFSLTGEAAGSHFEDDAGADRQGRASIVDASWRNEKVGLRAGYHDLASGFTSLSVAAQPGVREAYAGADWTAADWLTVGSDLRRSRLGTLASEFFAATFTDTDAISNRANITFGEEHPGWSLALQQVQSHSVNSDAQVSDNRDVSSTLNYSSPEWSGGIGLGRGKVSSELAPAADSHNSNWSFNAGRTFSDAQPDMPASWSAGINLAASVQNQRLLAGGQTSNSNYSLTLTALRTGMGSLNLQLTGGKTTQLDGAPSLKLRGFQLDVLYLVSKQVKLKMFVRNTRRNIDDPVLSSTENVAGLQLAITF